MKKNYPATRAGLKRLSRDLAKEVPPVEVPVQWRYTDPIPPQPPMPTSVTYNGPFVNVTGRGHTVAVGEGAQAKNASDDTCRELLTRMEHVLVHADELGLAGEQLDEVDDAVNAARRITAESEVDQDALSRRARRVLAVLGQLGTTAGAGVLAQVLAEPIKALLA